MPWKLKTGPQVARDSAGKAQACTLATTAVVALCGQVENGKPFAPINAVSHITFGDQALEQEEFSLKYTATGVMLNNSANSTWAALHEMLFGAYQDEGNVPLSLAGGALVSAFAYVTDFYVVPKRFTPGFEHKLSPRSLFLVYVVLALVLGLSRRRK
jgi:hypothetical protein